MQHISNYLSLESIARKMNVCPVCGGYKSIGAVVCWGECYRDLNKGYKHTQMDTEEWLKLYAKK